MGTTVGQSLDLRPPPPSRLGSSISGASGVEAGAIYLRSQGAQGREVARFLPGTWKVVGPSSDPTFAFHVVVHLKLHFAGPEEVAAVWTAAGDGLPQRSLSRGCWILGKGLGHWGWGGVAGLSREGS